VDLSKRWLDEFNLPFKVIVEHLVHWSDTGSWLNVSVPPASLGSISAGELPDD